jgi:hypothetical protein
MKKHYTYFETLIVGLAVFSLLFCIAQKTEAVVGIPDQVPAATLLVPFFEVGVSSGEDTLFAITNQGLTDSTLHCEIWDRDGNIQASQDITIDDHSEWHISMKAWLDALEITNPGIKANLQVGDYYWGYITFDSVTAPTLKHPYEAGYPFATNNDFTGWIYFVDLLEGKSNGLSMVPIEAVSSAVSSTVQTGFYDDTNDTSREEIDGPARKYAETLTRGDSYAIPGFIEMFGRFYQMEVNDGKTRMVIWRYWPQIHGALSINCDHAYIKSETGTMKTVTIPLDHVVNVIEIDGFADPADYPAGWIYLLQQKTNPAGNPTTHQIYGFTINSANSDQASLNWMAIFEMQISVH